ncbi:MAG TPA: site-2 protease family protein [Anaeromyxobacteraceae bacterium]|nr:site-2 protease family protein [Anaeromyxobacteraceae bacterium]
MPSEAASFRPPVRRLGLYLALGALAGTVVGLACAVPAALGAIFGAVSAGIVLGARHAAGLRVVGDERRLKVLGGKVAIDAPWSELRLGFGIAAREDGMAQRYAIFADGSGRSFAFAELPRDLSCREVAGADGRPVEVVGLKDAPLLLGLLVQRVPAWQVLPDALRAPPPPASAPAPAAQPEAAPARKAKVGLWGVLAKLGSKLTASLGKIGAGVLKAVKTANLGWAAASVATYSLLFSWKFGLALMLQLFVHEYGHVHAMRRTGMKVRGMYFVPLLGALAVTEDSFSSRRQQAYVALNGPFWGSLFTLLPAGLYLGTGDALWAAIAGWWALLNLFNLLPIAPLDGGRVMQAFACSYSTGLGLALSALGLAAAVALASAFGFSLIWFVAALGAMELFSEAASRQGARALRLLPEPLRFGAPHWLYLRAVIGPGDGPMRENLFLRNLERQQKAARAEPLRPRELVLWGLAYAALAAFLVALLYFMRHVPGAEAASRVLE